MALGTFFLGVAPAQTAGKIETVATRSASELRAAGLGYVESVTIQRPPPITTLAELEALNPQLPKLLPDLGRMLKTAEVSPRYAELYRRKLDQLKKGAVLTDHNYLDCATVLQLRHPESGRHCLFLQADMDVVTDGSDPNRAPELADYDSARSSDWFLPQTAYTWAGAPATPNPFLAYYPAAMAKLDHYRELFEQEARADKGRIWRFLIASVEAQKSRLRTAGGAESTRRALQISRSLMGPQDPFIVLPMTWFSGSSSPWKPRMGDYAAVVFGGTIYAAIVGEAGPTFKAGEASLRIAQAINPDSSGRQRAVSSLGVTYLIFPQTADPRSAPDLPRWEAKVRGYLDEIGTSSVTGTFHSWTVSP